MWAYHMTTRTCSYVYDYRFFLLPIRCSMWHIWQHLRLSSGDGGHCCETLHTAAGVASNDVRAFAQVVIAAMRRLQQWRRMNTQTHVKTCTASVIQQTFFTWCDMIHGCYVREEAHE